MHEAMGSIPALHKLVMVVHTYNHYDQEVGREDHLGYLVFEAVLGYVRPSPKIRYKTL